MPGQGTGPATTVPHVATWIPKITLLKEPSGGNNMYASYIKLAAQERWEQGYKPAAVVKAIDEQFGVLLKYRTLRDWARKGKWKPWGDDALGLPKDLNPNKPAGVSGIADPIYHLSLVMARRLVRQDSQTRSFITINEGRRAITVRALEAVDREYDPGPSTLDYLKPLLMEYITSIRKNNRRPCKPYWKKGHPKGSKFPKNI